jgi:hypothetical protein
MQTAGPRSASFSKPVASSCSTRSIRSASERSEMTLGQPAWMISWSEVVGARAFGPVIRRGYRQARGRELRFEAIDFDVKQRPHLESLLEPGESLLGICAASQQKGLFGGGAVALGVTDRRLLVQPLDRRGEADGEALALSEGQIVSAKAGGAGGGWVTPTAAIADHAAVQLKLRTTDGQRMKLMMMRGEGALLGGLGGGEAQRRGLEQLGRWFSSRAIR